MSVVDPLGDRMKAYERITKYLLPRRSYTIIRVDGRHFHSMLRNAQKPFDWDVYDLMNHVATELASDISGTQLAYVQSDEVSLLLTDFDTVQTQPHFGGVVQKIVSTAAATATAAWHVGLLDLPMRTDWEGATFDARVWQIPDQVEVANYFLWRQRDARRNALQMVARSFYSHGELVGLNNGQLHEKLGQEKGVNFNRDYTPGMRLGRIIKQNPFSITGGWSMEPAREIQAKPNTWFADLVPTPSAFVDLEPPSIYPTRKIYPNYCKCGPDGICQGHEEVMPQWRKNHLQSLDAPAPHPHGYGRSIPSIHVANNPETGEPYL